MSRSPRDLAVDREAEHETSRGGQPDSGSGPADTVFSGGPEDDAGHHDCES
jgi:hypothetical protein